MSFVQLVHKHDIALPRWLARQSQSIHTVEGVMIYELCRNRNNFLSESLLFYIQMVKSVNFLVDDLGERKYPQQVLIYRPCIVLFIFFWSQLYLIQHCYLFLLNNYALLNLFISLDKLVFTISKWIFVFVKLECVLNISLKHL